MKLLDCTFRDGGYYNNWEFNVEEFEAYLKYMQLLNVDVIEIGYVNNLSTGNTGRFFNIDKDILDLVPKSLRVAVLINSKDWTSSEVTEIFGTLKERDLVVRLATTPDSIGHSLELAKALKSLGLTVALNVMYASKWRAGLSLSPDEIDLCIQLVDIFYVVDSYGGLFPDDIELLSINLKSWYNGEIGFHGHDNLSLAFANSLEAMKYFDYVDSTVLGMGRGAGNCRTESVLLYKYGQGARIDLNELGSLVRLFEGYYHSYNWGTNYAYSLAGLMSYPQKTVMEWISDLRLLPSDCVSSIASQEDSLALPSPLPKNIYPKFIIIGGGDTVNSMREEVIKFIKKNPQIPVFITSSKWSSIINELENPIFLYSVGSEGRLYEENIDMKKSFMVIHQEYVGNLRSYSPRVLLESAQGGEILNESVNSTTEGIFNFLIAKDCRKCYLIGFDGYSNYNKMSKNTKIFEEIADEIEIATLTPSRYSLKKINIYKHL